MADYERMLTCKVAVTFEYDLRPTLTWRGEVKGRSAATVCHRAVMTAQKELRPVAWRSMVCCILERLDAVEEQPGDAATEPLEAGAE